MKIGVMTAVAIGLAFGVFSIGSAQSVLEMDFDAVFAAHQAELRETK